LLYPASPDERLWYRKTIPGMDEIGGELILIEMRPRSPFRVGSRTALRPGHHQSAASATAARPAAAIPAYAICRVRLPMLRATLFRANKKTIALATN
jgi:hypothetical protein